MHADEMATAFTAVDLDSDALDAARLLAEGGLPGIVVTDASGSPHAILPATQVVRFLVPSYVQDDPSLAGVLDELAADKIADRLSGRTVRSLLPDQPTALPEVDADDTIVEVAVVMARMHSPLVAVVRKGEITGVITATQLLQQALARP